MRLFIKIRARSFKIAAGAVLSLLAFGGGAMAQTQQPKGQSAPVPQPAQPIWVVNCRGSQDKLDCRAGQSVAVGRSGRLFLSVAVRVPPDTKKPILLLQAPLGVYLPAGVSVQFGKDVAKMVPYTVCGRAGCVAEYPITEAELATMLKGADLTVSAQNQNQQPAFTVRVPVAGFSAAYAKIR